MVVVKLQGGLGNQMFQYALGRSLSLHLSTSLKLDLSFLLDRTPTESQVFRNYELSIFKIDISFASLEESKKYTCHYDSKPRLLFGKLQRKVADYRFYKEKKFTFNPEVFEFKNNTYLDGFWQSPKYFNSIKNTILKDFSFRDDLPDTLTTLANEIKNSNSICLHVRRADYVSHPNAKTFHGVKGIDYFNAAISLIAQALTDIKIYVFSDDISWCVQNLKFEFTTTFVEYEYPYGESKDYFRLMKLCKHFIIPNSSFSWWAAWLNQNPQKIVIAPKKWFNDPMIDTSDLIPDAWIRI